MAKKKGSIVKASVANKGCKVVASHKVGRKTTVVIDIDGKIYKINPKHLRPVSPSVRSATRNFCYHSSVLENRYHGKSKITPVLSYSKKSDSKIQGAVSGTGGLITGNTGGKKNG